MASRHRHDLNPRQLLRYLPIGHCRFALTRKVDETCSRLADGTRFQGGAHQGAAGSRLVDQRELAYQVLKPNVDLCEGRFFHVRSIEAHVDLV